MIIIIIAMVALIAISYMMLNKRISSITLSPPAAATTTDYTIQPTITGATLVSGSASLTTLSDKISMLTYDVKVTPNANARWITCVIPQPTSTVYTNMRNVIVEGFSNSGASDIYNLSYASDLSAKTLTITFTVNDTSVHDVGVILFLS